MAVLVDISSCQLDCAYPTGSDVESVISSVIPNGENPSVPTINVTSIHLVCLAHGDERDRYRLVSFLVQYACLGNPNCPFGIVLEQFESSLVCGIMQYWALLIIRVQPTLVLICPPAQERIVPSVCHLT